MWSGRPVLRTVPILIFVAVVLGPSLSAGATAQVSRTCTPELASSGGRGRSVDVGRGRYHQFVSGGVRIVCIGQSTTVDADSLAWYQDLNRLDFVGRVRFRDTSAQLEAASARYYPSDERLEAYGDVRLEDEQSRSLLTGPTLTYFRAAPGIRDTTEMFATRRPRVEYRPVAGDPEDPYVIRGDRVRLKGAGLAWAGGDVTIDRIAFSAQADSAALDLDRGLGDLIRRAEARGTDSTSYTIRGQHIAFRIDDGDLSWVQAERSAEAISKSWIWRTASRGDRYSAAFARNSVRVTAM